MGVSRTLIDNVAKEIAKKQAIIFFIFSVDTLAGS